MTTMSMTPKVYFQKARQLYHQLITVNLFIGLFVQNLFTDISILGVSSLLIYQLT